MNPSARFDIPTPRTLGRYEIIGALARGGMATVYLANHRGEGGFQRLYAIKILHPHLADDKTFIDMLLDEARIAARLHHPNVVPIVDLGSQDGVHYVAMEYVEGCSFGALLVKNRNRRPPRLLLPIVLDTLSGLHAAHTLADDEGNPMHLVHRDVSPQNVLVGVDGAARITDFGIAKAEARINSTQPGQMKGKLAFMAPEQAKNASLVDARADVFSAGVMMWCALTGKKLFLGASDAETLTNVLHAKIEPPSTVGHKPPAVLDAIILRALERDPEKRFASALELEEALREAATKENLLGTKREIAEWVTSAFGLELTERRAAIRTAVSQVVTRDRSLAAPATIPSLGSITPAATDTPSGNAGVSPTHDTIASESPAPRRRALYGVGLAVAAAGLAFAVAHFVNARSEPAASAATASSNAPSSPASVAVAATPPKTPDPVTPVVSAAPPKVAEPVAVAKAPPPSWRAAPPPPPPPKAKAPPPPPPPTPDTKKKPAAWDNDSPLPPQ